MKSSSGDVLLSRLVLPYTIFAIVPFVVMLAILESGRDLPQRIIFGIVAILVNILEVGLTVYMIYRQWKRDSTSTTLLQYIDSFLGLVLAWGIGGMAFYTIDTTATRIEYFAPLVGDISGNNWIAALQFTANGLEHAATTPHSILTSHVLSDLYYAFLSAFHFFYLAALVAVGIDTLYQSEREKRRQKKREAREALLPKPPVVAASSYDLGIIGGGRMYDKSM